MDTNAVNLALLGLRVAAGVVMFAHGWNHLARMETRVMLNAVLDRLPGLRLDPAAEDVEQVKQAIEAKDWDKFETAFHAMIDQANSYHAVYDKPWLRYKIPDDPPPDLDVTPLQ